ncbi:MAG TPA: TlpA disulfide reductase family protein [Longimicrobiales bacterium]|nr:TlpA disulfide reductase family protein [Longimicrobiales bacterium]
MKALLRPVLMATLSLGVVCASGAAQEVGLPLGTQAPPAALEDLDGNAVELLDYVRGKPALLEFWATWCENCEALQPQMDEIHARYGDRLQVVAVAVAVSQTVRRVKRHVEEHKPGYPYLWDAKGAAVRAYRAPTTSVIVVVDADGRVVYTGAGGGQDLLAAVAKVLE